FDDHHPYQDAEIDAILRDAAGAVVVTTTKDHVRLSARHRALVRAVAVTLAWKNSQDIEALLDQALGEHPNG
ncbi:MAG: tetraacyldisaccharide 4'-kinase, partial [Rhodospirillales bacterium]|nr:tetraacyldisaccharide 4'-kinase [Rhodospirillales bacterium]